MARLRGVDMWLDAMRYGSEGFDLRRAFMQLCGRLQGRNVVFLDGDLKGIERVLVSSHHKGNFVEQLIACPAWGNVLSTESTDGDVWRGLATGVRRVMGELDYEERLPRLVAHHMRDVVVGAARGDVIDAETLGTVVARIMIELVFETPASDEEAALLYAASVQWRREIAVKGPGEAGTRARWWAWLEQRVSESRWGDELRARGDDKAMWLSVFAQPFLLSPVINLGDIMVEVHGFLDSDVALRRRMQTAARRGQRDLVLGLALESIRLRHPFPILEREVPRDIETEQGTVPAGSQVFIMMDRLRQDPRVRPDRWLLPKRDNPYHALPFGVGRRMCIGKPIATILLADILMPLLAEVPFEALRPRDGHQYSGRANDTAQGVGESLYQLGVFGRVLLASYRIGRGRCPVTGRAREAA